MVQRYDGFLYGEYVFTKLCTNTAAFLTQIKQLMYFIEHSDFLKHGGSPGVVAWHLVAEISGC